MYNIEVGPLVGDIETTAITVRTFGASVRDALGRVTATSSTTTRRAVVHPATRAQLERTGLDHRRATLAVYTSDGPIATVASTRPAQVDYQGRTYETTEHGDYGDLGGIHLMLVQLVDGSA